MTLDIHNEVFSLENMLPGFTPPSSNTIFNDIRIDNYCLPAQQISHVACNHSIFVSNSFIPSLSRDLDGLRGSDSLRIGDVIVNPSGVNHTASWDRDMSYTILTINKNYFNDTAYEFLNPDHIDLLPSFSPIDPFIHGIIKLISAQSQYRESVNLTCVDELALSFVTHLFKNYCSVTHKLHTNNYSLSYAQLNTVQEYIKSNLSQKIRLQGLADLLGISRYHFARLFKTTTNITPAQYIMQQRLEKATLLLKRTNLDAGLIARQTGFYDHSHLCRVFRQHFSVTPEQYRRN